MNLIFVYNLLHPMNISVYNYSMVKSGYLLSSTHFYFLVLCNILVVAALGFFSPIMSLFLIQEVTTVIYNS